MQSSHISAPSRATDTPTAGHAPAMDVADRTLHEIASRVPGARDVLLAHGLDLCCGGDLPLRDAARLHALDLEALLAELPATGHEA